MTARARCSAYCTESNAFRKHFNLKSHFIRLLRISRHLSAVYREILFSFMIYIASQFNAFISYANARDITLILQSVSTFSRGMSSEWPDLHIQGLCIRRDKVIPIDKVKKFGKKRTFLFSSPKLRLDFAWTLVRVTGRRTRRRRSVFR